MTCHPDRAHEAKGTPPACGKCVRCRLCRPCNTSAGQLGNDPARLRRLADYLEGN